MVRVSVSKLGLFQFRSKQNVKNPKHPYVDIGKYETYGKFQKKIFNSLVVGARRSFQFFRKCAISQKQSSFV